MDTRRSLAYATLDLDRERRQGLPEVVYGPGKTAAEIMGITHALLHDTTGPVLVTRLHPPQAATLSELGGEYDAAAKLFTLRPAAPTDVTIAVVTAGTSDGPTAAETAAVARAIGLAVLEVRDVGVAGLHRLLDRIEEIRAADAVVVIAGMEGALASVVAGLVSGPVIAVPTSTGYGAALDGITALLSMISSCANGVTVVNIDSGFAAAMAVHRLAMALRRSKPS